MGQLAGIIAAGLVVIGAGGAAAQDQFRDGSNYMAQRDAACLGGDLQACARQGQSYFAGLRVPQDLTKAARFLGLACRGGVASACNELGQLHVSETTRDGGPSSFHNIPTALRNFELACTGGIADACLTGARAAAVPSQHRDFVLAARLLDTGCSAGSAQACGMLGQLHEAGVLGNADMAEAVRLYRRACQAGDQDACSRLPG